MDGVGIEGGNGGVMNPPNGGTSTLLVLQLKPIATYKSNDEYLVAMKEDLAEWFTCLYKIAMDVDNFFEVLETGVVLCEHANEVRKYANEQRKLGLLAEMHSNFVRDIQIPQYEVQYRINVKPQTFQARDNLSNFITWTKKLGIPDVLCFETDDLVLRKNEKSVVLCLLEIARVGAKLGMLAPTLVKMEEEIDAEIAGDPPPQIKTCDVKSLHEMVKDLAGRCTCPVQFPIIKVGEGKYKIGDSQTLVFVRILRNHVMIRVGGGWDTLEHYLDKHDPCRCGFAGHKSSQTTRPVRRQSTPAFSHSQSTPNTPKTPRKMSAVTQPTAQRPASPARMRSVSPSPVSSPRKMPSQNANLNVNKASLSQNVSIMNSNQQKSVQGSNLRRSESPVPSKLRSPSPGPEFSGAAQVTTLQRSQVHPVKQRCTSPAPPKRSVSPNPTKRSTSPNPNRGCVSPGPNRKPSTLSVARSKPTTPHAERRQLPRRPSGSMDSSGNNSTDLSPETNPSVSMDAISTMTLDQFKTLLNNALSVPNGHNSESSLDSPRSQSSTDGMRHTYTGRKKSMLSDQGQKYKTWSARKDISKSFDSDSGTQSKTLSRGGSKDEYYELDRPAKRPPAVSTISRPKTPVSSSVQRPKTPVSSSVQRPKTPVSTSVQRPKTPVSSSVQRPKTPSSYSNVRPTTPVSQAHRPKTPISQVTSKIDTGLGFKRPTAAPLSFTRPKTPTRFQDHRVETAESRQDNVSSYKFSSTYTFDDMDSRQDSVASEKENDSRLSNLSTTTPESERNVYTSYKPEINYKQISEFSTRRSNSEPPSDLTRRLSDNVYDTDVKFNENNQTSYNVSSVDSRPSTLSFSSRSASNSRSDITSASSSKPPSPNISYVTIKSYDDGDSKSDISDQSQSSYFSKTYQAMRQVLDKPCEIKQSVSNSTSDISLSERPGSARSSSVERSFSSRQGSFSSLDSSPTKEDSTRDALQKSSRSSSFSRDDNAGSETDKKRDIVIPRPSTPARPSTPSLIPRPSTPSLIPRPSTPLSNLKDSIDKLEKQPAYASSTSNSSVSNRAGRPPTPRKATIIAKSPSSNNTVKKDSSTYSDQFASRRSKTPGPTTRSSTVVVTPRRSRTPGPGERESDYSVSQTSTDTPRAKPVDRRPRTPSFEPKPLTRQNSGEGNTVITVNRTSGKHVLTVNDQNESRSATPRTGARIIARSPTAQMNRNTNTHDSERSRTRVKPAAAVQNRPPRPKSVDPESFHRRNSEGEQVLSVKRQNDGSHFLDNRMEAWVESAAKNTKTVVKSTRSLPPRPQRSKTPNPRDFSEHELQSRPLEEIKAALSMDVNGLKEIDTTTLDAPPEDPEMYAKMDELFQKLKEKELKASVNEVPGSGPGCCNSEEGQDLNSDELSLDSNENIKRRRSSKGSSSYQKSPSPSSRSSVPSTPPRPRTPSLSKDGASNSRKPFTRASSTPPRPSTPSRSSSVSRMSSANSRSSSSSSVNTDGVQRSSSDHASVIVSKIKEIINTKPRPEDKTGFRSRIPAPKSLSITGKSKSFSNLSSQNVSDNRMELKLSNGDLNKDCYYDDECGQEVLSSFSSSNGDITDYSGCHDTSSIRSGTETPVPKFAPPLTTGRKEFLNNQRDANNRTPKLVRAVSISSLSSSSNTLSYTVGDDDEFV